ncbi:MAG: hypothetical protein IPJ98_31390 [Bryobacterales bacterium]|nr:hypothetical protein [Bryobacterales bacterium]
MHQAALDVSLWPAVLQGWAELFHAEAVLFAVDAPGRFYTVSHAVGLDESHLRRQNVYYSQIDPFMKAVHARKLNMAPSYSPSHLLVADADLEKSECYNDHMRPLNHYYGFGFTILPAPSSSHLGLIRAKRSGPVEGAEDQAVQSLIPHLRQAVQTTIQFATLTAERDSSFSEPLDALDRAVFLLDASAKVLRQNRSAAAIAAALDGLTVHADGLRASTPHHTTALRRQIALAAHSAQGGTLALPRPSQSRPYAITVSPLHREPSAAPSASPSPPSPSSPSTPTTPQYPIPPPSKATSPSPPPKPASPPSSPKDIPSNKPPPPSPSPAIPPAPTSSVSSKRQPPANKANSSPCSLASSFPADNFRDLIHLDDAFSSTPNLALLEC